MVIYNLSCQLDAATSKHVLSLMISIFCTLSLLHTVHSFVHVLTQTAVLYIIIATCDKIDVSKCTDINQNAHRRLDGFSLLTK